MCVFGDGIICIVIHIRGCVGVIGILGDDRRVRGCAGGWEWRGGVGGGRGGSRVPGRRGVGVKGDRRTGDQGGWLLIQVFKKGYMERVEDTTGRWVP